MKALRAGLFTAVPTEEGKERKRGNGTVQMLRLTHKITGALRESRTAFNRFQIKRSIWVTFICTQLICINRILMHSAPAKTPFQTHLSSHWRHYREENAGQLKQRARGVFLPSTVSFGLDRNALKKNGSKGRGSCKREPPGRGGK